jgi:hypothetical protein
MSRHTCILGTLLLLVSGITALAQPPASRPSREQRGTQRPSTRPSREQMMMRMRYEGRLSEEELVRPVSDVVQELLQSDDRRILDMLVHLLRRKVVSNEQIATIIKAAEDPDSSAKRPYFWQVLFDSGSPSAYAYLEKSFSQKNDEGAVLEFLQEVGLTNVSSVPLIIKLFETQPSEMIRGQIIKLTSANRQRSMDEYADQQRTETARATLLSWLLQHADSDAQKEKLLTGNPVSLAIADDALVALGSIKSPETRTLIYKRLLRYPQEPWLSHLLANEKDPQVQVAVIRGIREAMELGTERGMGGMGGMGGEMPPSLRAAARNAPPAVKTEIQQLLEVARKRSIEQVVAGLKQSAMYRNREMGVRSMDPRLQRPVEAEVDDTIQRLKMQYGDLPEEAQIRQRLTTEITALRRQLEQPETRPE